MNFKDNMQRDALLQGIPFCYSNEEERFLSQGYSSHLRWAGVLPTGSCSVYHVLQHTRTMIERIRRFITPLTGQGSHFLLSPCH